MIIKKFNYLALTALLVSVNLYAEDGNLTAKGEESSLRNFVEVETNFSSLKLNSNITESSSNMSTQSSESLSNPEIRVTYLRSLFNDDFRLATGVNFSNANYKVEYFEKSQIVNPDTGALYDNQTSLEMQNSAGLSLGGEYDLYKTKKFAIFATAMVNINVANIKLTQNKPMQRTIIGATTTEEKIITGPGGTFPGNVLNGNTLVNQLCREEATKQGYTDFDLTETAITGGISISGGQSTIGGIKCTIDTKVKAADTTSVEQVSIDQTETAIYIPIEFGLGAQYNFTDKLSLVAKAKYVTGYNLSSTLSENGVETKGELDIDARPTYGLGLRYNF
jgi:hypothetical protein